MKTRREPEDAYSPEEEDRVAGRLPSQKETALRAKAVRSFLINNPGATTKRVKNELKMDDAGKLLEWLRRRGLVRWTYRGWEVIPL